MKISWKIVKSALGGARKAFMSKWKIIAFSALATTVMAGAWKINASLKEREILLKERDVTIAELYHKLTIKTIENQTASDTIMKMEGEKVRLDELYSDTVHAQREIRDAIREQKREFEKYDLGKLINSMPGLVEGKSNAATQELFDELEDAFNR